MSRKNLIEMLLTKELAPVYLLVENESRFHHVPPDSETHFKITAVAERFLGLNRLQRHRLLNALLKNEFSQGLHALSLHLYTLEEWEKADKSSLKSPNCKDGFGK